jgi:hypothetical protein
MHRYRAYGLTIASESVLPELVPADFDTAAVTIRRGQIGRTLSAGTPVVFDVGPRVAYLAWREVGAFLVKDGETIVADLRPGIPDDLARLPLLGAVLAVLLHQRGLLILHGSAGAIADQAVIFVGSKGAGKSTMAAALLARGHRFIADDLVAVDCTSGASLIVPGYPQLKLSELAAGVVLQEPGDALPRIHQASEKRWRRVGEGGFATGPVRPGRIYALARGDACKSIPLGPQAALTTLLQYSYMARFGNQVLHGAVAGSHLRQCVALANRAAVHLLEVPDALQDLDRTARLIEADLGRGAPTASAASHLVALRPGRGGARLQCAGRTVTMAPGADR